MEDYGRLWKMDWIRVEDGNGLDIDWMNNDVCLIDITMMEDGCEMMLEFDVDVDVYSDISKEGRWMGDDVAG